MAFFLLFIQKHIYNGHINKMKGTKTKIHKTVIRCNATITHEIRGTITKLMGYKWFKK